MIISDTIMFRLINWIADQLGLTLDFREQTIVESLAEHEVSEQLRYGRD